MRQPYPKLRLVQFRAHRGPRESHIGGHIVCFYNVIGGKRRLAPLNVVAECDEVSTS